MITLVDVVKNGNRILGYNCLEDDRIIFLPKEDVIAEIEKNNCTNGRLQKYNGSTIIRVQDGYETTPKPKVIDLETMPMIDKFKTATRPINPWYKFV